jgi:hypothetical protein
VQQPGIRDWHMTAFSAGARPAGWRALVACCCPACMDGRYADCELDVVSETAEPLRLTKSTVGRPRGGGARAFGPANLQPPGREPLTAADTLISFTQPSRDQGVVAKRSRRNAVQPNYVQLNGGL